MKIKKIGFGGGCHWCTEAYFQSLKGVEKVEQGWISSTFPNDAFSEAVIVNYNKDIISLEILIAIHLSTHASTKMHSFREKYRSAIYVFDGDLKESSNLILKRQMSFDEKIITVVLPFENFQSTMEAQQNYYQKNKEGAFCERYILPKLKAIEAEFSDYYTQIHNCPNK